MTAEYQKNEKFDEIVIKYLGDNPHFLAQHPDLLAMQKIPHESGSAISLIERQVKVLQERSSNYHKQLTDLIDIARENDHLNRQLHRLTLNLIESKDVEEMLNVLQDNIRNEFNSDFVKLKLFINDDIDNQTGDPSPAIFKEFIDADKPSCGELGDEQLSFLFGENAGETKSVALVPIKTAILSGILAIGSKDAQRFHNGSGNDFLQRLGEIVSLCLQSAS